MKGERSSIVIILIILIILVVLDVLLAFGALYGGAMLIAAPDGSLLGLDAGKLTDTPLDTFLIPGLVLFLVFGVGPCVLAVAALMRRPWTRYLHLALGCGLIVFELVECWMIGYHFLQAIYGVYGLILAALGVIVAVAGPKDRSTQSAPP